jgi:hypothetical protein
MIYVENDFYSNFNNAVKANDEPTIHNMLVDQISTLIARRRGEVIELYQKVGVPVSANPSNEELVNKLISNIKANQKLQAGIGYLITKENDLLVSATKQDRKSETGEQVKKPKKKSTPESTADTVTAIAGTLRIYVDALKGESLNKFKKELTDQSNVKAPNYSGKNFSNADGSGTKSSNKAKKSRKWLWIGLGVAAVATLAYVGHKKGWFKKESLENIPNV